MIGLVICSLLSVGWTSLTVFAIATGVEQWPVYLVLSQIWVIGFWVIAAIERNRK